MHSNNFYNFSGIPIRVNVRCEILVWDIEYSVYLFSINLDQGIGYYSMHKTSLEFKEELCGISISAMYVPIAIRLQSVISRGKEPI